MNADSDGAVRDERSEARQDEQLRSLTLPQFKTVPTATRRTGLRLESAFWTALDWLSRTSGADYGSCSKNGEYSRERRGVKLPSKRVECPRTKAH